MVCKPTARTWCCSILKSWTRRAVVARPTKRADFKLDGPAIWRGGYNSGRTNSVNNLWLFTECGINRVAIRSTLKPGQITLTATRSNLEPAKIQIESKPVEIKNGLGEIRHR